MNNRLLKSQCDSCGAPLSGTKQRGKYICKYCGTVFYDPQYYAESEDTATGIKNNIASNREDEIGSELPEAVPPALSENVPHISSKNNHNTLIIIGIMLAFALIGLITFSVLSGFIVKDNRTKNAPILHSIEKPVMLSSLPAAARAGESIAYANWEIVVDREIEVEDNKISITLSITNWNDRNEILRYKPNDLILYDNAGNTYPLNMGNCDPDLPYLDRQITFEKNETITFVSGNNWCGDEKNIPTFSGMLPLNFSQLYFHPGNFGVFTDITFVIDL